MAGDAKKRIEEAAEKAVRAKLDPLNALSNQVPGASRKFGCLNPDNTKVVFQDGSEAPVQVTGRPVSRCGPVTDLGDGTYHMEGRKVDLTQVDGAAENAFVLLTADWQDYYVKKVFPSGDDGDPVPELYKVPTDMLPDPTYAVVPTLTFPYDPLQNNLRSFPEPSWDTTVLLDPDPSNLNVPDPISPFDIKGYIPHRVVRFSLDGKHIVVLSFTNQSGGATTTLHYAILQKFKLVKADLSNPIDRVEYATIDTGEVILDSYFTNIPNSMCQSRSMDYGVHPRVRSFNPLLTTSSASSLSAFVPNPFITIGGSDVSTTTNTYATDDITFQKNFLYSCIPIVRKGVDGPVLDLIGMYLDTTAMYRDFSSTTTVINTSLSQTGCASDPAVVIYSTIYSETSTSSSTYTLVPKSTRKEQFWRKMIDSVSTVIVNSSIVGGSTTTCTCPSIAPDLSPIPSVCTTNPGGTEAAGVWTVINSSSNSLCGASDPAVPDSPPAIRILRGCVGFNFIDVNLGTKSIAIDVIDTVPAATIPLPGNISNYYYPFLKDATNNGFDSEDVRLTDTAGIYRFNFADNPAFYPKTKYYTNPVTDFDAGTTPIGVTIPIAFDTHFVGNAASFLSGQSAYKTKKHLSVVGDNPKEVSTWLAYSGGISIQTLRYNYTTSTLSEGKTYSGTIPADYAIGDITVV